MGLRPRLSADAAFAAFWNPRADTRGISFQEILSPRSVVVLGRAAKPRPRVACRESQEKPGRSRPPDTPHRISLRLAARLLRLPLKGGVIALGARASRPHPVPLAAAELQCDAAGSHPVCGNPIGQAEGEPWFRSRSIQVGEMAEAVPGLVRAGRPRSQEAVVHTLDRKHGLHHAKESGKKLGSALKNHSPLEGESARGRSPQSSRRGANSPLPEWISADPGRPTPKTAAGRPWPGQGGRRTRPKWWGPGRSGPVAPPGSCDC